MIDFNDTSYKSHVFTDDLIAQYKKVLRSGMYFNGPQGTRLHTSLSRRFGTANMSLVGSGHDALHMAIMSLHLEPTDEVIVPVNAYPSAFPVMTARVTPVFVDVDINGLINPESVARAITRRTRAIIVVHLYGMAANLQQLKSIAQGHSIAIIEDCAQAFGTTYMDRHVGTMGDFGCFSFYPTKNLGTHGDAGAVIARSKRALTYIERARQYGEISRYDSQFATGHSRVAELQAASLNTYLRVFDRHARSKNQILKMYQLRLQELAERGILRILWHNDNSRPNMHLLVIQTKRRRALMSYLSSVNIPTGIHYPRLLHNVRAFAHLTHRDDFTQATVLNRSILSLPYHAYMTERQVEYVCHHIAKYYRKS